MVRKSTEVATRAPKGAVNTWEADMEREASVAAEAEAMNGGGQFIGLAAGQMTYNGAALPNNELRCIVLDNIYENVYYEGDYDAGNPTAPKCFAYGRYDQATKSVLGVDTHDGGSEMAPHKSVLNRVCDTCAECPMNQFGTSKTGRGKACKNTRRLALIPVQGTTKKGAFIIDTSDTEHYSTATMAYLKTPVTSGKVFSGYVSQVASLEKRPAYGVFTRIFTTPNADNQFTLNFEAIDRVPNSLGRIITDRHNEAMAAIAFPYTQLAESEDEKPKAKGKQPKAKGKATPPPPPPAKGKPVKGKAQPRRGGSF